ncbi:unnamed protein product, partial [Brassica rapa]
SASTHRTFVAVSGCPSAHTGRLWLSVFARVCLWVSASIHRTFVAVRDCPSAHIGRPCVCVYVRQHTQDVRGCPSVHISARWPFPWTVRVILATWAVCSVHKGRPWVSVSTQDVCGCPSAHTGRSCVSVCVRQHTQDVRRCPSVHISARWSLDSPRWPFPWTVWVILAHVGCLFSTQRTTVGVRQNTQDICACPWLSVSTHRTTSVCVRQHTQDVRGSFLSLDSAPWPFPWTVLVILAHVGCLFSTQRTSVGVRQHTQDVHVRGCPSVHTGHLWLSM